MNTDAFLWNGSSRKICFSIYSFYTSYKILCSNFHSSVRSCLHFYVGRNESSLHFCVGSNAFYSVTSFSVLFHLGIVLEIGNHACISVIKVRSPSRM